MICAVSQASSHAYVPLWTTLRALELHIYGPIHVADFSRRCVSNMVNWHDPTVINKDYLALIKLDHALAGIYIWETVFTMGFELDVLRGKRPYKWTIWLYLGTRYTALLAFILYIIDTDGGKVPCEPFEIAIFALAYANWAFASLIIVLRVIAIWNHKKIPSRLAIGVWLVGLALNIYSLTTMNVSYNATPGTCTISSLHKLLVNSVGVLVVDVVLLMSMLIGLLRFTHRSSTGIWHLLYQQCIIWIALAGMAEVPFLVLISLDLNDSLNYMFSGVTMTILSIGAARMYRSLSQHGSFTEYMSSDLPQVVPVIPSSNPQYKAANANSSIHFATATQSSGTVMGSEAVSTDHIRLQFILDASNPGIVDEHTKDKAEFESA
ncbi:hypothetical protein BJV78DRAFT_1363709 [Lactifluus subvellereus]|nr:hypothetical protein BJV78DRAFT_1363709 [Lactifluus subvellereus]